MKAAYFGRLRFRLSWVVAGTSLFILLLTLAAILLPRYTPKRAVSLTRSTTEKTTGSPGSTSIAVDEAESAEALPTESPDNIVFPPDAGIVDVTQPPYNAKGDGKTDDTAAIQQALNDYPDRQVIVYLPNGTYLVTGPLRWGKGDGKWRLCKRTTLQGQSRDGTIIRLADAAPGYDNPDAPQPVIWTGPNPAERYRNSIRNLTVDTGQKNPGAVGVQFNANYVGCVRQVLIRAGDGEGATGLDLSFCSEIGPLLVKHLVVRGFDVGIRCGWGYGVTLEHITLEDQRVCGFINNAQAVSIRDLLTSGTVPAFWNKDVVGLAVIVDAEINGLEEAEACAAITNRAGLFVRNVSVKGFASAISQTVWPGIQVNIPGPHVQEWASRQFPGSSPVPSFKATNESLVALQSTNAPEVLPAKSSLNLLVKETPEVPWDDPSEWANAMAFGANPNRKRDASEAIQEAIDSGKSTVYLPCGDYLLRKPIILRGKVRRFIGCEASLIAEGWMAADAIITVAEGDSPVVVLERIACGFSQGKPNMWFFNNASRRTFVIRDCLGIDAEFTGPGPIFLENVAGKFAFHGQQVWARQVCAGSDGRNPRADWWHLRNEGGTLWALGVRTGGPGPVVITTRGGRTEILGGLMHSFPTGNALDQPEPAFVMENGALSVSIMEMSHTKCVYSVLVSRLTNSQSTDLLLPQDAPGGIGGSLIPLFVAD